MTSREFRDRLTKRARRFEIRVTPAQVGALEKYLSLLTLWNARINLTALRLDPPDEASFDRLLLEPLAAVRFLPAEPVRVVDIGSGSGSPAIPMAIAGHVAHLTLVESKTRKSVFLMEAVRHLGLDASVETARYEQLLSRPDMHESFDVLTIRAVRVETRSLLSLQAFIKPNGCLFWFRGRLGSQATNVPPPLRWQASHPLLDVSGGTLVVLVKEAIGRPSMFHVEQ